ncbi:GNAT family N-acetyltransferase [Anaeromicropila herbilytica]|uniref:N-acetyltransferase domain-containing protein n=1 Tax=Anaeromicropila herbilytica TaxID=2785025 RepID=A0A7R7IAW0_9FIRM|nr:GNAT family N-acetyltransferase [Anaeromicropila herbilytica]BCN28852.1 hypothetical protein bsdtb5_01470 [Anaeromicropila herbilytica]
MMHNLKYQEINEFDYATLTKIMTEAFNDDTKMHTSLLEDGPRGYNDGTLVRRLCSDRNMINRKIIYQNEIIGLYVLSPITTDTYEIEMIALSPKYKQLGIGTNVWRDIENTYRQVKKWIVETPEYSKRNIYFYTVKCGFEPNRERVYDNGDKSIIFDKLV